MKTDGDLIYYESLAIYLTFSVKDYAGLEGAEGKKIVI